MSSTASDTMKVVFRVYPDGEVIAIFPEEPADVLGLRAVAYSMAAKHHPVDPKTVLVNTKPAPDAKIGRLKKALTDPPFGYKLEVIKKIPNGCAEVRAGKPERYKDFPRIRHMPQSNP